MSLSLCLCLSLFLSIWPGVRGSVPFGWAIVFRDNLLSSCNLFLSWARGQLGSSPEEKEVGGCHIPRKAGMGWGGGEQVGGSASGPSFEDSAAWGLGEVPWKVSPPPSCVAGNWLLNLRGSLLKGTCKTTSHWENKSPRMSWEWMKVHFNCHHIVISILQMFQCVNVWRCTLSSHRHFHTTNVSVCHCLFTAPWERVFCVVEITASWN